MVFPWKIAKSAEGMFSRWAMRRICKFVLKKKLGRFILGDIDLEQLDVQLTHGTIQFSDLALNVDYLNEKIGKVASLVIKEGSVGSLLVKMPWKSKGFQVEVDELELILAPRTESFSSRGGETSTSSQDATQRMQSDAGRFGIGEMENSAKSIPSDVHEGVKTIAKLVKWFLASFNVKIKKLIVAFDPNIEEDKKKGSPRTSLVLRVAEIECGTCVSEDLHLIGDTRAEILLPNRLTNFVKFSGAVLELLQMDVIDSKSSYECPVGTSFDQFAEGCPSNATTPIMTGKGGGFSGSLSLSIPWKQGSLDIRKVDADVCIDPLELRFQPSTIGWLLSTWETCKSLDKDRMTHMPCSSMDPVASTSHFHLPTPASDMNPPESINSAHGGFSSNLSSLDAPESVTEDLLPGSNLIPDWVSCSMRKNENHGDKEVDFGASVDQFFECFDGIRSYQSALASSVMWNWTSSVFTAITAASSLATGSLDIPSEQKHVQTNLKASFAGITAVIFFSDECDMVFDTYIHHLGAEFSDIIVSVQVCTQEMRFEGTLKCFEVADYLCYKNTITEMDFEGTNNDVNHHRYFIKNLRAQLQSALPPFDLSGQDADQLNSSEIVDNIYLSGKRCSAVKTIWLSAPGATRCRYTVSYPTSNQRLRARKSFSLNFPPFICWLNFDVIDRLVNLFKKSGKEFDDKTNGFQSCDAFHMDEKKDSRACIDNVSSMEIFQGNISVPTARVILCFPIESGRDSGCKYSPEHFVVLDLLSPTALNKGTTEDGSQVSERPGLRTCFSSAKCSLRFSVGDLNIYLATGDCKYNNVETGVSIVQGKLSANKILSVSNGTSCFSVISMFWQDDLVSGPWIAEKAKFLATSEESRRANKFMGKGHEFASVATAEDQEDMHSQTRREIVSSSAFCLHVQLLPATIHISSSQYSDLNDVIGQIKNWLSCMACDATPGDEFSSVSQTSILVECDSVEIIIRPRNKENIKGSMQNELPGSWNSIKLCVQKFMLLSVSNIGGIRCSDFFWLGHSEGKLFGSCTGMPDIEFLLISCSNSTMKRGNGLGSNALSSRSAGSDILHFWEPKGSHGYTSISVRSSTVVAVGGRLDWLEAISSFFSLASPESESAVNNGLEKRDCVPASATSFILNLVDVGLSYEPCFKNLVIDSEVLDRGPSCLNAKDETCEHRVACLLAASSLKLFNTSLADSLHNDYKLRVDDLGLLLCIVLEPERLGGTCSVDYLRDKGYVKVAQEALIEANLRTNSEKGLIWEVECSRSHIYIDTCSDTTSALICLASQLQQLVAPDLEESAVHLQTRWNNIQQPQDWTDVDVNSEIVASDLSASQKQNISADTKKVYEVVGLMDEISEDAFQFHGNQTRQFGSLESQHMSFQESFFGEASGVVFKTSNAPPTGLSVNGSLTEVVPEGSQTVFIEKEEPLELIENYYLSDLSSVSLGRELSGTHCIPDVDVGTGSSGWYEDNSLRVRENHMPERDNQDASHNRYKKPSFRGGDIGDLENAIGRMVLKNINIRWRMFGGSDWHKDGKQSKSASNICGRDPTVCIEFDLSGMQCLYDVFPIGGVCVSKLSLSVQDFHIYDRSKAAPWKLVLRDYCSKEHPRESSSKAFKMELEAVRPDPQTPLEEYRLRIALLPLRLHLHQSQLDFLISFFGAKSSSVDKSLGSNEDSGPSKSLASESDNGGWQNIIDEALLPYFQKLDIWPFIIRVDYNPGRVDLAALRDGKYVELVNLVPWKGIELQLKHVHASGIYGWGSVCETIVGEWLEDISQNQVHKLLQGLPTISSLVALGAGAAKLVSQPIESYKKDRRVLKGLQRGTTAFVRSVSLEAVGLGVHLAAGAHDLLLQAEYILTGTPSLQTSPERPKANVRHNQPKNAQQGIRQACESISNGLGKSVSAIQAPLKKHQRGCSTISVLESAFQAVPTAAIAPASACTSAVHYTLLGLRNSLDPERKKESMEKYSGSSMRDSRY